MGLVALWKRKGGYYNWWLQRISVVFPSLLLVTILYQWWVNGVQSVLAWHAVFMSPWVNILVLLASFSILVHAYLGIWTVCTDYIHTVWLRRSVHLLVLVMLLGLFIWSVCIAMGVSV